MVHGKGLGRTIGIPTSNLVVPQGVLMPAFGVYATRVWIEGKGYLAVTNVGVRPTVENTDRVTVEPWILDFDGDLYGQNIRWSFISSCGRSGSLALLTSSRRLFSKTLRRPDYTSGRTRTQHE